MSDILLLILVVAFWWVLNRVILPKAGVYG